MLLAQLLLLKEKNLDSKQKHPVHFKEAMIRSYKLDKSFCLQYIAASENVRLSYTNATVQSIKKQAENKAKQQLNKNYPCDKQAVHGPPHKCSNFRGSKRPNETKCTNSQPIKKKKVSDIPVDTSTDTPDYTRMMKTCKVLYDDDKWYKGTITADGEFTYATRNDPEVKFP